MNVTGCFPLAGRGLVARRGSLVGLTDGRDAGPDPLLAVLTAVADADGDGTDLVLAATRAALEHGAREHRALEHGGRPAWACAGVTSAGEVAVLVHGEAVALVSVAGGQEAAVTASGSMIPVAATFAGAVVAIRLVIDAQAVEDPRLWLGAGTVSGGGLLLTVTEELSHLPVHNGWPVPAVTTVRPAVGPAADAAVLSKDTVLSNDTVLANDAGHQPTMLAWPAAAEEVRAEAAPPYTESWFTADDEPAQAAGPTLRMTRTDNAGAGSLSEPPIADLAAVELVRLDAVAPVLIDGTMCERMHFNSPAALSCRACGASLHGVTRNSRRQARPPLGVLLVDDGRGYVLDRDYVIGREPLLDGDVAAGRAAPLPVSDPGGSVSRLHLRIALAGWRVEAYDLGSSNGSVLYRGGGPRPLAPLDATELDPGTRVGVGRRTVQFLPYSAFSR